MPFPRRGPIPPARMVQLLSEAKHECLDARGCVTREDFDRAWDEAWATMIVERAYPHSTADRRGFKDAMMLTRSEMRAAFLDQPTAFGAVAERLTEVASEMGVQITPDLLPLALIEALRLVERNEEEAMEVAS